MSVTSTESLGWVPFQQLDIVDPIGMWIGSHSGVGDGTGGVIQTQWNLDTGFMYMLVMAHCAGGDANGLATNTNVEFFFQTGEVISAGTPRWIENVEGFISPNTNGNIAAIWEPPKVFILPEGGATQSFVIISVQNLDLQAFSMGCRILVWPRNTFVTVPMRNLAVWLA